MAPALVIAVPGGCLGICADLYRGLADGGSVSYPGRSILRFFYLFQAMNLFGGADAYALIVITACIPFHPFETISGTSPLGFFPSPC